MRANTADLRALKRGCITTMEHWSLKISSISFKSAVLDFITSCNIDSQTV